MKFQVPEFISKLLTNKFVLYLIAFLSITNVIGYMMMNNLNALILFFLIGLLTSRFSKNMTIILLTPLILVNFLMTANMIKEGMTTKSAKKTAEKAVEKAKKAAKKAGKREHMENMDDDEEEEVDIKIEEDVKPNETFEVGAKGRKGASRVDYGTTIENAYDDLDKIIGGDGIKKLTEDTQRLVEQQTKLAEAMNNMGPLLNSAKDMLKGFDMSNMGNIGEMMKSLQG